MFTFSLTCVIFNKVEKQFPKDAANGPYVHAIVIIILTNDYLRRPVKPRAYTRSHLLLNIGIFRITVNVIFGPILHQLLFFVLR